MTEEKHNKYLDYSKDVSYVLLLLLILYPIVYFLFLRARENNFDTVTYYKYYLMGAPFLMVIIYWILITLALISAVKNQNKTIYTILFILSYVISPLGIIMLIIYWNAGRHSQKVDSELRQAQLEALRKGNVNVDIIGKMRKLK